MSEYAVAVDERLSELQNWLSVVFSRQAYSIQPLAGDASFRRYFRVRIQNESYIVMDAPPSRESCMSYLAIAKALQFSGVRFPFIFSADTQTGFVLLSDFGDRQLLQVLTPDNVNRYYNTAFRVLNRLQTHEYIPHYELPFFNADLYWKEFDIFFQWYLIKNKQWQLTAAQEKMLRDIYQRLIDSALSQPSIFVHRDFHSRNLMVCDDGALGVLDFQDAVWGPITYDCVSLLRDCYVRWPEKKGERWVHDYYRQCKRAGRINRVNFATFQQWFDWMGLQRHLKCLGIFSRLSLRDEKHQFLNDVPRVLQYVREVCDSYSELTVLKQFL